MSGTNVKISEETWRRLNSQKDVGDSFDDVIRKLLDDAGAVAQPYETAES